MRRSLRGLRSLPRRVAARRRLRFPRRRAHRRQARASARRPSSKSIADESARSIALFEEAGKVILHPRCVNCHPAGDRPLQGMAMRPHEPPVSARRGGFRHGRHDLQHLPRRRRTLRSPRQADDIKSIPGNPNWHLAPIEMAWEGKSLGEICEQIKDPARNGGKDLDAIVEHMAHDDSSAGAGIPAKAASPRPARRRSSAR